MKRGGEIWIVNVRYVSAVIVLFCVLLISSNSAVVQAVDDNEPRTLTPLTNFGQLGVEDLETNYYALIVEWTQKSSLDSNVYVEVCYIDPRLALATDVLAGKVDEGTLEEHIQQLADIYASHTPFKIKLSHDTDAKRLDLREWEVTLTNDKGDKYVLTDVTGGNPELKASYSRGNFYQADYDVSFLTSGEQFLDSNTKWMSLSFSKGDNHYEITWDFQAQASALEMNVFETTIKILISLLTVLLCIALIATRPKVSILNERFRTNQ